MKRLIIIIGLISIIAIAATYFMNKENDKPTVGAITAEELAQGWYWGETKLEGTPDTWKLMFKGTRSARWADPAWNGVAPDTLLGPID